MNILGKPLFYHPQINETIFTMSEEESRHCAASLRFKEGDEIFITDGKGKLVKARLQKANPKGCVVETIENEELELSSTFRRLVIAPPKTGERLDLIIEKATEIGVDEIVFIETRYAERDKVNLERLNKIAISAMKQSKQLHLPHLVEMIKWKKFIDQPMEGKKLIAAISVDSEQLTVNSEQTKLEVNNTARHLPLTTYLLQLTPHNTQLTILIGPEGDFSEEEVSQAVAKGYQPISLGKNILRTETAAIYALSLINAFS